MKQLYIDHKWVLAIVAGIVIILLVGSVWWLTVYLSPQRAYSDMLANTMATQAVTKNVVSVQNGTTLTQRVNLQFGGQTASRWLVTATHTGGSVTTESIGTPTGGYLRYVSFGQTNTKKFDSVLGVWARGDASDTSLSTLFSQAMLDTTSAPVPPIGDVNPATRQKLLTYMSAQNVFAPDFTKTKRTVINGRSVYAIPVKVKLAPYVAVMQEFAHVYKLTALDDLNASDYANAQPLALTLYVDRLSHQLTRVVYPATGFNETFTDYGIRHSITLPANPITITQLQQRLNAVH